MLLYMIVMPKRTDYISWDKYFMQVAELSAQRSKDPSTQVGACIVNPENKIVGIGYNGMPIGINDDEISKHGIQAVNVLQPAISRFGFNDPKKVYFIIYGGSNRDVCASSQLPSYATEGVTANTAALYYPGKRGESCIENNGGFKPEFNETAKGSVINCNRFKPANSTDPFRARRSAWLK